MGAVPWKVIAGIGVVRTEERERDRGGGEVGQAAER